LISERVCSGDATKLVQQCEIQGFAKPSLCIVKIDVLRVLCFAACHLEMHG
jgi:hypothetical protein